MNSTNKRGSKICLFGATIIALLVSCKTSSNGALFETDEDKSFKQGNTVPLTPAGNQGGTNFCWAYGVTALMESLHKSRTGQDLALSPEFLGIHHLARKLKAKFEKTQSERDLDPLAMDLLNGKLDTSSFWDRDDQMGINTIIESHGVVPLSVYSVSFAPTPAEPRAADVYRNGVFSRIYEVYAKRGAEAFKKMSEKEIIAEILVAPNGPGYTAVPPESFQFQGKSYTPKTFLKEVVRFDTKAMVIKLAKNSYRGQSHLQAVETTELIAEIEKNIKAGIAVPFAIYLEMGKGYRGTYFQKTPAAEGKDETYGHLMTIVGPTKNPVRADQDIFIIKNSWGTSPEMDGTKTSDGLYLMDVAYIKAHDGFFAAYLPKVAGKKPLLP